MINLRKVNKSCVAAVIMAMCLMTTGCGSQNNTTNNDNSNSTTLTSSITSEDINVIHADDADNYKTELTGTFSITSSDGTAISQNGSVYTITQAGEYTVTGLLSEGQIIVDASDDSEVTIVLNSTSITCSTGSPIYIKNADNVKIKSEENTYNCIVDARAEADDSSDNSDSSDSSSSSLSDNSDNLSSENGNAAIYATCDLKFVGKGALSVTGGYNNGIQSKDGLSIKNVTIKVTAVNNAIKGNDSVDIESGEVIAISKKGNGVKTSNSSLSNKGKQKGNVSISGGNIDIYAACDGIDAAYGVDVSGDGNLNIYTDSYSEYSEEVTAANSSSSTNSTSSSNSGSKSSNSSSSSKSSASANMMSYTTDTTDSSSTSDVYTAFAMNTSGENGHATTLTANTNNQNNGSMGTRPDMNNSHNNGSMETPPDMNSSQNNGSMVTPPDMNSSQNNGSMGTPPDMNNNQDNNINNNSDNNSGMRGGFNDGNGFKNNMPGSNTSGNSAKKSYSTKGIKADSEITISGATINISSTDDGIHANSDSGVLETGEDGKGIISVSGGTVTISTGDDGIHADKELNVTDGYINVVTSYEGLEAVNLNISGGKIYVYATDDGLNACTGDGSFKPLVNITGGYVDVTTASGDTDGIDSNGNYTQSGGMVLVKGGSSSGQVSGSIDVDGTITVTGGTCVALGGVCETPENSVNAYVFSSVSFNTGNYSIKDSNGNEILGFSLNGNYSNGWICTSALKTDTEYTLYCDDSSITNWTQTSGTMGASSTGGFGNNGRGFNGGGRGGNMNGNMNGNGNMNSNNK